MRLIMVSLLMFATTAICSAEVNKTEIYKWVDEKGNVGYADDLGKVPKKFRDSAVITDKMEQPVEIIENSGVAKTPQKGSESKGVAADDKSKVKAQPTFDGKSGEAWKQDFARHKHDIKSLEEQSAGIKERLAEGNKLSRSDYLSLEATQRDLTVRITKAKKKLDTLNENADKAELPAEFR